MDKPQIVKELESLMHVATSLEKRLDDILYQDIFLNLFKDDKKLESYFIQLQEISIDIQENIRWNIQDLIKEIDPAWNVFKYLEENPPIEKKLYQDRNNDG
jgi:hypothetical protein